MCRFIFLLGVCLALVAVAPAPAAAAHVRCGDTITSDLTLTHDLRGCPGPGLVIGAPNITLELGFHVIRGSGTAAGIDNSGGYDGVVISAPNVRNFARGIVLVDARRNLLDDVQVSARTVGIDLRHSPGTRVSDGDVTSRTGVRIVRSSAAYVLGVVARVTHIAVDVRASHTTLDEMLTIGGPVELRGNENHITLSSLESVHVTGGGNRMDESSVWARSRVTNGIWIEAGRGNRVEWVDIRGHLRDGILVGARALDTVIAHNVVDDNGDDGIDVNSRSTTITANTATGNGDLGIEAIAGVVDGGGNAASGNGNPAQCVNVVCT